MALNRKSVTDLPALTPLRTTKRVRSTSNDMSTSPSSSGSPQSTHSALQTSSPEMQQTSSMSSLAPSSSSSDIEDSSSSASDSGEADSEDDEIETVTTARKPDIRNSGALSSARDLQSRLQAFLPQFAKANENLDEAVGNMEEVEEGQAHIEMNLGLGVLKEVGGGRESESESDCGDSEEGSEDEEDVLEKKADEARKAKTQKDVLSKLMGGKERRDGAIEEVG